eukprot:Filipodium_phascolosomae@DN7803_c0_g1_i1.p1
MEVLRESPPFEAAFKLEHISHRAKNHLLKTYAWLILGLAFSTACGVANQMYFHLRIQAFVLLALSVGAQTGVAYFSDRTGKFSLKQVACYAVCTGIQGLALSPVVAFLNTYEPTLVPKAVMATGALFLCLSGAALFAKRRQYMYLGAILGWAAMYHLGLIVVSMIWRVKFLWTIEIYLGIAIFAMYVIYDTQMIIEEVEANMHSDPILSAVKLYYSVMALFVKILEMLAQKEERKKKEK